LQVADAELKSKEPQLVAGAAEAQMSLGTEGQSVVGTTEEEKEGFLKHVQGWALL
jgi:hypothetical protein